MTEKDGVLRSVLAWDGTAALSVVLAVCAWLIEAALDAFVFRLGPLPERLFPLNDPNEIWHRLETITFLLIFILYRHAVMAQRKRVEAERAQSLLREHEARRCCEQAVRVRAHVLAAASHDLRTPLATIVRRSGLLQGRLVRQPDLPEAVDLSALVRTIVVVGATTFWLTSRASGSVPVLIDQRSTPHAVTLSAGPAWCDWRGGCGWAP